MTMSTPINPLLQPRNQPMIEAALRYARADRSDPFTKNRVLSHIANGVCTNERSSIDGAPLYYDATPTVEHRTVVKANGETIEFPVPSFKSLQRV